MLTREVVLKSCFLGVDSDHSVGLCRPEQIVLIGAVKVKRAWASCLNHFADCDTQYILLHSLSLFDWDTSIIAELINSTC